MTRAGGIAADHLRSFVERIERLKDEQDALGLDIREVYAEAKSEGFDKTAMGQVVAARRKRAKNPERADELASLVDLYMHALGVGTDDATHTHETEFTETPTATAVRQDRPAPAKLSVREPAEPTGSGGAQDRIGESAPPPHSTSQRPGDGGSDRVQVLGDPDVAEGVAGGSSVAAVPLSTDGPPLTDDRGHLIDDIPPFLRRAA